MFVLTSYVSQIIPINLWDIQSTNSRFLSKPLKTKPKMKSKRNITKHIARFILVMLILISSSCTSELAEPINDLEKKNGKTNTAELKTLVRGAALNAANGIDVGPDGNLYVASVNGQEIIVMDKNNGKIIRKIKDAAGGVRFDVISPDDLVWSPDGTALYWTDILTGEVGRLKNGIVKKQWVAPGVNPIAFNDDGRLFVALDFLGDGLYEIDPELDGEPRAIVPYVEDTFPLGFFNSFDFGPGSNGRLFGPLFAAGLIISVDVGKCNPYSSPPIDCPDATSNPFGDGTARVEAIIPPGPDGLPPNPAAAKFDPEGLLTVLDQLGRVWKIDLGDLDDNTDNGDPMLFTTLQPGLDNMVFDDDGSLYMTNNDEGWVAEILSNGQARILSPGGMIVPQGIAVMPGASDQDAVFQADLFTLRQFNGKSGQQEDQFKGFLVPIPGVVSLTLPQNLSVSGSNLVISSFFSSTVQIWNPESDPGFENIQDFADHVGAPIDAVQLNSGSGDVIVSDVGGAQGSGVYRMSDNSKILSLVVASGLATDGVRVWAADWFTGTIHEIDFTGGAPTTDIVATGLSTPEGLALDNEGRLLVYETRGLEGTATPQLSRIDIETETKTPRDNVTVILEGLEPADGGVTDFPPMWLFDGVDVGSSGDIYLTGGEANAIHKIPKNKIP